MAKTEGKTETEKLQSIADGMQELAQELEGSSVGMVGISAIENTLADLETGRYSLLQFIETYEEEEADEEEETNPSTIDGTMTPEETQDLRNFVSSELKEAEDEIIKLVDDTHNWDAEMLIKDRVPERMKLLSSWASSLREVGQKMDEAAGIPIPPQAE
jgi:hypothetical protein